MLSSRSSDCLDEAKRRVYSDPSSNRSWNFCWLVLMKIKGEDVTPTHHFCFLVVLSAHFAQFGAANCSDSNLIPYYATYQAAMPTMWGGRTPTSEGAKQLANAFTTEWTWAVEQMLRHWEEPPCR